MGVNIKDMNKHGIEHKQKECEHHERHRDCDKDICCVCLRVRRIDQIQKESMIEGCFNCEAPQLGGNIPNQGFNTRPFTLYLPNGDRFEMSIDPTSDATTSIYRVEEVRGCCAVLRALNVLSGPTYEALPFCVTVDLCKFIGIQCFGDAYVAPAPI